MGASPRRARSIAAINPEVQVVALQAMDAGVVRHSAQLSALASRLGSTCVANETHVCGIDNRTNCRKIGP